MTLNKIKKKMNETWHIIKVFCGIDNKDLRVYNHYVIKTARMIALRIADSP